jgi:hypothetical protein
MARSDSGVGIEDQGLSLNEFDEDTGQTTTGDSARGVSRDEHIGETVAHWGFEDDGQRTGRGRQRGRETGRRRRKWKKKKRGGEGRR